MFYWGTPGDALNHAAYAQNKPESMTISHKYSRIVCGSTFAFLINAVETGRDNIYYWGYASIFRNFFPPSDYAVFPSPLVATKTIKHIDTSSNYSILVTQSNELYVFGTYAFGGLETTHGSVFYNEPAFFLRNRYRIMYLEERLRNGNIEECKILVDVPGGINSANLTYSITPSGISQSHPFDEKMALLRNLGAYFSLAQNDVTRNSQIIARNVIDLWSGYKYIYVLYGDNSLSTLRADKVTIKFASQEIATHVVDTRKDTYVLTRNHRVIVWNPELNITADTGFTNVQQICAGAYHVLLLADGKLYGKGYNTEYQLGITTGDYVDSFVHIPTEISMIDISCASNTSIALSSNHTAYAFGRYANTIVYQKPTLLKSEVFYSSVYAGHNRAYLSNEFGVYLFGTEYTNALRAPVKLSYCNELNCANISQIGATNNAVYAIINNVVFYWNEKTGPKELSIGCPTHLLRCGDFTCSFLCQDNSSLKVVDESLQVSTFSCPEKEVVVDFYVRCQNTALACTPVSENDFNYERMLLNYAIVGSAMLIIMIALACIVSCAVQKYLALKPIRGAPFETEVVDEMHEPMNSPSNAITMSELSDWVEIGSGAQGHGMLFSVLLIW